MKIMLALVLTFVAFEASATRINCSFRQGTVTRANGQQVARSFSPRVLQGLNQVTIYTTVDERRVSLTSIRNFDMNRLGDNRCVETEMREGYKCFQVYRGRNGEQDFRLYVSTEGREALLYMSLGGVGGTFQTDAYRCL